MKIIFPNSFCNIWDAATAHWRHWKAEQREANWLRSAGEAARKLQRLSLRIPVSPLLLVLSLDCYEFFSLFFKYFFLGTTKTLFFSWWRTFTSKAEFWTIDSWPNSFQPNKPNRRWPLPGRQAARWWEAVKM